MAIIDILLPKMGESVAEATIIKLLVDAGSSVEADEAVVEIATDKPYPTFNPSTPNPP